MSIALPYASTMLSCPAVAENVDLRTLRRVVVCPLVVALSDLHTRVSCNMCIINYLLACIRYWVAQCVDMDYVLACIKCGQCVPFKPFTYCFHNMQHAVARMQILYPSHAYTVATACIHCVPGMYEMRPQDAYMLSPRCMHSFHNMHALSIALYLNRETFSVAYRWWGS